MAWDYQFYSDPFWITDQCGTWEKGGKLDLFNLLRPIECFLHIECQITNILFPFIYISGPHRQIGYFYYNCKQTLQKKTKQQNKSSSRKPRRRSLFSSEPLGQGLVKQTVVRISNITCHLGHHPPKILSFCSHARSNLHICTQWLW